ncbi:MAG: hypothetical protein ACLS5R_05810 [Blautia sp.]
MAEEKNSARSPARNRPESGEHRLLGDEEKERVLKSPPGLPEQLHARHPKRLAAEKREQELNEKRLNEMRLRKKFLRHIFLVRGRKMIKIKLIAPDRQKRTGRRNTLKEIFMDHKKN